MSDTDALRESGPSGGKIAAVAGFQVVLVVLLCGMLRVLLDHVAWYRSFRRGKRCSRCGHLAPDT